MFAVAWTRLAAADDYACDRAVDVGGSVLVGKIYGERAAHALPLRRCVAVTLRRRWLVDREDLSAGVRECARDCSERKRDQHLVRTDDMARGEVAVPVGHHVKASGVAALQRYD